MNLNDFMFVFGLGIAFSFIALLCFIAIAGRNEEARQTSKHTTPRQKTKHRKHVLRSA